MRRVAEVKGLPLPLVATVVLMALARLMGSWRPTLTPFLLANCATMLSSCSTLPLRSGCRPAILRLRQQCVLAGGEAAALAGAQLRSLPP